MEGSQSTYFLSIHSGLKIAIDMVAFSTKFFLSGLKLKVDTNLNHCMLRSTDEIAYLIR